MSKVAENLDKNDPQEQSLLDTLLRSFSFLIANKKVILLFTAIGAAGSIIFSVLSLLLPATQSPLPNYYQSSAVIIVGQDNNSDMSAMLTSMGFQTQGRGMEVNSGELAIRVLDSRPFIDSIIEKHNIVKRYNIKTKIQTNARKAVQSRSRFDYESRTGTLAIGYEDIDPVFARDVVDSMVANIQSWFENWEGTVSEQELVSIKIKIEEVSEEMTRLEDEILNFQEIYGVFSVEQLAETQATMIVELQSQLIQTEIAIENYSRLSSFQSQELTQLQAQRDSLKSLIRQIEMGQGTGSLQNLPPKDELPSLSLEFSHLRLSHEIQMRIFQNLQEQYEIKRLSASSASTFSVLEPAEIAEEKSRPRRSQICMVATIAGFILGIAAVIIFNMIKSILENPEKRKYIISEHEDVQSNTVQDSTISQ